MFLGLADEEVIFKRASLEDAKTAATELIESGRVEVVTVVCLVIEEE